MHVCRIDMKSNADSELENSLNTMSSVNSTGRLHQSTVRCSSVNIKSSSRHPVRHILCITAVSALSVVLVVSVLLLVFTVRRSMFVSPSDADQTTAASDAQISQPPALIPSQRRQKPQKLATEDVSRQNRRRPPAVDQLDRPRSTSSMTSSPKPSVSNSGRNGASRKRLNVTSADGSSSLSDVISRQLLERGKTDRSARLHLERRLAAELQRRRAELAERRRRNESETVSNNSQSAGRHRQRNNEMPSNELRRRARLTLRRHQQLRRTTTTNITASLAAAIARSTHV